MSPTAMETSGCAPIELCQAFSDVLLSIKDVDADDYDNPMLCSEYVKDIYKYLQKLEVVVLCFSAESHGPGNAFYCPVCACCLHIPLSSPLKG